MSEQTSLESLKAGSGVDNVSAAVVVEMGVMAPGLGGIGRHVPRPHR